MLALNVASRTLAYRRLAQGLSRALSVLPSFFREYLDKVQKADQSAQYVDDMGIVGPGWSTFTTTTSPKFP